MEEINNTTYNISDLGDNKPVIVLGGKDESKFIPNLNMSFYDDEFFINLNRKNKIVGTEKQFFNDSQIKLDTGSDTDIWHIDENGRLKWDIDFLSCPESMIIEWELQNTDGLKFYYQGELTEEEIKHGAGRPDNIIGSYAVYCTKKNNKYKTGKLLHIPRPFVIDEEGNKEWCILYISDGILRITLPENFMQTAVYPVRLDPTFGYTSAGASIHYQYTSDNPQGLTYNTYTASTGDTITNFHFYGGMVSLASVINMAAYSISASDLVSRLGSATSISVDSATAQWWMSSAVSIAMSDSIEYGLAFECYGEASNGCYINYDNLGAYGKQHSTAESLPATWSTSSSPSRAYSIYATYTEGGGGETGIGTDGINFSESATAQLAILSNASDYILLSESVSTKLDKLADGLDGIDFSESATANLSKQVAGVDGIVFADSATGQLAKLADVAEAFNLSEAEIITIQRNATGQDGITFSELANAVKQLYASGSDGIIFSEYAQGDIGGETTGTGIDGLKFSELASARIDTYASGSDIISFSEIIISRLVLYALANDGIIFSDIGSYIDNRAVGIVTVTFTSKGPRAGFEGNGPYIEYEGKKPKINFVN